MHRPRTAFYVFMTAILAIGGLFMAAGTAAHETGVAQPGGDLPGEPEIALVKVAGGLVDPINAAAPDDGTGRLFIVERTGTIRILQDGQVLEEPFLDISGIVKTDFLEQGLLGLAFHPDYANNGRFFVFYSEYRTNGDHFLVEYRVSEDDPNVADPESFRIIFTADDPYTNHNGGTLQFGPDGYLYLTIGDGGLAGDPYDTAQDTEDVLGSILRFDVDAEGDVPYGIPPENPFAPGGVMQGDAANELGQTGEYKPAAAPEIWAWGLRNAWQFQFDPETGDMYIADVGQVFWEEINHVPADEVTNGGQNFGWDVMEGSHCYPPEEDDESCAPFGVLPVAEYEHGDAGCSITGLGVHRADDSDLNGVYLSSDFCSGKVWGLAQDDAGTWQFEELFDSDLLVTGAGQGANGEVYLTACSCSFGRDYDPFADPQGEVYQIVPADQVPEGAETAQPEEGAEEEAVEEGEGIAATPPSEAATPED